MRWPAPSQTPAQPTSPAIPESNSSQLSRRIAIITGAARGIGRTTALALARAGADIVAVDISDPNAIASLGYPLATPQDLAETERQIKQLGRRCLAIRADVRNMKQVRL